jgi:hypothetical protein
VFSVFFCIIILTFYLCLSAVLSSVGGLNVGIDAIKKGIILTYIYVICNQGRSKAVREGL